MKTPEDWAADIQSLFGAESPVVEDLIREAMQAVYEDILDMIEDEYMDAEGIAEGIRRQMLLALGEDDEY